YNHSDIPVAPRAAPDGHVCGAATPLENAVRRTNHPPDSSSPVRLELSPVQYRTLVLIVNIFGGQKSAAVLLTPEAPYRRPRVRRAPALRRWRDAGGRCASATTGTTSA